MRQHHWFLCVACVTSCGFPELLPLDAPDDIGVQTCNETVDLANDPLHCGRCDHACGGATCVQGECQPLELARDIPTLHKIAISDTALYWSEASRIASCPLPQGCVLAPRSVADPFYRLGLLAVHGEQLFFGGCNDSVSCTSPHRLFHCPTSGCPRSPSSPLSTTTEFTHLEVGSGRVFVMDRRSMSYKPRIQGCSFDDCEGSRATYPEQRFGGPLLAMELDGDILYVEVAGLVRTCPASIGCIAPGMVPGTSSLGDPFTIHNGVAYWMKPPAESSDEIVTCTLASCHRVDFQSVIVGITELEADDTGLYWINKTTGTIRHCPHTGCPQGGATYVVRNLSGALNLTLGPGFVYYTVGGSIYKVAKP